MTQQPSTSPSGLAHVTSPIVESTPLQFNHRWSCVKLGQTGTPPVHLQRNPPSARASIAPLTLSPGLPHTGNIVISTGILKKRKYDFSKIYGNLSETVRKSGMRGQVPNVSPFEQEAAVSNAADHSLSANEQANEYTFSSPGSSAVPSTMCRICLESTSVDDLISPCVCRGTQQWVHEQCLKLWLIQSEKDVKDLTSCEVCKAPFRMNFYYSLLFAPCGPGADRKYVWIPFALVLFLLIGISLVLTVSDREQNQQSSTVIVLTVLFSVAAGLCALMGVYLAKELWFIRTIEEWQIESLPQDSS